MGLVIITCDFGQLKYLAEHANMSLNVKVNKLASSR